MQVLATDRSTGQVKRQLAGVERQLADCIRRWKILTVIATLLETVRLRYETDRQPQTLREASGYLARLTDGHYTRVWMPLDRRGLLVENDAGDSLPLDVLSRGTREAVFIGLRLALVTSFARRGAAVPLVLDDVLVNFDSDRVRCAAEVLCDFAAQGHQVLMFTCHEHITDIFEDARAEVRVLPSRDGKRRERRRRPAVVELPPPLPAPPPEEPSPVRTRPEADPNPLFQMAAADEPVYDPVHPLPERPARPEKPRRTKKKKPLELPDYWPLAELPASQPPPPPELELPDAWPLAEVSEPRRRVEPLRLDLPDSWPLAPLPAPSVPLVVEPVAAPYARPLPETFEVLAYRAVPESAAITITPLTGEAQAAPVATVILSPAEPTPPAPKRLASRRRRFTWESPEMYWEEQ
jgi:hypothetical protein